MKRTCLVLAASLLCLGAAFAAEEQAVTLDDLSAAAEQWAKDNLDEEVLKCLQSGDRQKIEKLFKEMQRDFHGEYVLDLAALKDLARTLLPLLEAQEETRPYALWLKTRLDYLDVAEELRRSVPPPKAEPGKAPAPPPNAPPKLEREVWIRKLAHQPWPEKAKPYVSKLKPIFALERVPAQLVWIAEVESSFDPRARSPEGAAGLFQLMPATARRYGLRTWPFDQRVRLEPSARATAQYLHYLHHHYRDWRLALAAYNAGEGTVDRLLARHKQKTFDAIATKLPAEAQMYVPRVEAVLWRREGVKISELRG